MWVGWGLSHTVGERVKTLLDPGAAYVITDNYVHRHARTGQMSMEAAGIPSHIFVMESGERHKSLDTLLHIYRWLAERKAERRHVVVAVGGGVVGDVAGYAAATYLRGMPVVQAPTTLVAMMDAAVGGKTAVDLPQGKNLVGAFKQPEFVLADVEALSTLSERALVSGWAEAITGLNVGQEVITEGVIKVRPGVPVRVAGNEPPGPGRGGLPGGRPGRPAAAGG